MEKKNLGKTFEQIKKDVAAVMAKAPTIAGVEGVNHFKQSFRDQGFTDESLEKWKARKSKRDDAGRAVLTKTGRLRRGVKVLQQTDKRVVVGVDLDEVLYAQVHNDGFSGTVNVKAHRRKNRKRDTRNSRGVAFAGAHQRRMNIPKRQFIGESRALNRKIEDKIQRELKKAFETP